MKQETTNIENKQATAPIVKQKTLPITASVTLDSKNGRVRFVMDNPFKDEPLDDLRLTFIKPDNQNKFNINVEKPEAKKTKGFFEYHAKKVLKLKSEVPVVGTVKYLQMRGPDDGKLINFISIDIENPFPFFEDRENRNLKVYLANLESTLPFAALSQERLELQKLAE